MSEQLSHLQTLLAQLERWEETIKEALSHGRDAHTFDDIVSMVLQNRVFFFCYDKAFVIMEKIDFPQFSVFHCFLAGGEMEAVLGAHQQMEAIGRTLGCKYLSTSGRKGWERQLPAYGWARVCTTMYKDIGEMTDEQRQGRKIRNNGQAAQRH